MLRFALNGGGKAVRRVLCLGAHSDDIEIGCGGTVLRLLEENPGLQITWVVFSANPVRKQEALASARLFLGDTVRHKVIVKAFKDSYFPSEMARIKAFFEKLKQLPAPDLVLTHFREDLHQDHRVIADLTWNAFRNHTILEYEIPKYDGDLGAPNFFVGIPEALLARKIHLLLRAF